MWISVGLGPVLWGVDYGNDVWFKQIGQIPPPVCPDYWTQVGLEVQQVDVGKNGHVWAVGNDFQVYWREGVSEANKAGTSWSNTAVVRSQDAQGNLVETPTDLGKAHQVVLCTNGQSWQRTLNDKLAVRTGVMENMMVDGTLRERIVGRDWQILAGQQADRTWQDISCGQNGKFVAVDQSGLIYVRKGVNMDTPHGTDWMRLQETPLSGKVSVSVGEQGQIFVLDQVNHVAYYAQTEAEDNSVLVPLDGQWSSLDVGNLEVFAIDLHHGVYKRSGVADDNLAGNEWEEQPYTLECEFNSISTAESGVVWAIDPNYGVSWILNEGSITTHVYEDNIEHGWTLIENYAGNTLIQVDSGYNSQLVGVSAEGKAYYRTGITKATPKGNGWSNVFNQQSYSFLHITMCDNGRVWATDTNHLIHFRTGVNDNNPHGDAW